MSLESAQQNKRVIYYELIDILVGDNYYITNAPFDIVHNSNTYKSFGMLVSFDAVEENTQLEIASLSITISGIAPNASGNSALVDLVGEEYASATVNINRIYYEQDFSQQGVVNVYRGYITGADLLQSADKISSVNISTASHWHDFQRSNSFRTNTNSQQKRSYAGSDVGFDYSVEVQKEITWQAAES